MLLIKKILDLIIIGIGMYYINLLDRDNFYLELIVLASVLFGGLLLNFIIFTMIDKKINNKKRKKQSKDNSEDNSNFMKR